MCEQPPLLTSHSFLSELLFIKYYSLSNLDKEYKHLGLQRIPPHICNLQQFWWRSISHARNSLRAGLQNSVMSLSLCYYNLMNPKLDTSDINCRTWHRTGSGRHSDICSRWEYPTVLDLQSSAAFERFDLTNNWVIQLAEIIPAFIKKSTWKLLFSLKSYLSFLTACLVLPQKKPSSTFAPIKAFAFLKHF